MVRASQTSRDPYHWAVRLRRYPSFCSILLSLTPPPYYLLRLFYYSYSLLLLPTNSTTSTLYCSSCCYSLLPMRAVRFFRSFYNLLRQLFEKSNGNWEGGGEDS